MLLVVSILGYELVLEQPYQSLHLKEINIGYSVRYDVRYDIGHDVGYDISLPLECADP